MNEMPLVPRAKLEAMVTKYGFDAPVSREARDALDACLAEPLVEAIAAGMLMRARASPNDRIITEDALRNSAHKQTRVYIWDDD